MDLVYILVVIGAYLLGSIPFSIWTARLFYGIDIREHGSGNAGATNVWRVLGWKAGISVLALDILKGFAATRIPLLLGLAPGQDVIQLIQIICGVFAALGHIFPLFAGFRGGKGVATLLGIILGLMPLAALCSLGVFLFTFVLFRYVSLGSILAAISLPLFVLALGDRGLSSMQIFALLVALAVVITHRKNLRRLIKREENRVLLFRRRG